MGYVTLIGPDGFPEYYSIQFVKLHMPSEHMINGRLYAAELQVRHTRQKYVTDLEGSLDDEYPLVAVFLFDIGTTDSHLLNQFYLPEAIIPQLTYAQLKDPLDLMRSLGPALDGDFYRYDGSLTFPQCHENVKWLVFSYIFTMSRNQWMTFKAMFPNPANNRPVQPLNNRVVAKNSFQDGDLKKYDFYLNRHTGRDRNHPGPWWIITPIVLAVVMMITVMLATFVREGRRKLEAAGGLTEAPIGKPLVPHHP